ncbi:phenylacetate-CoA oxygenase subunit PaaC [Flavobacteriales bacterium]|nr:phenylacetate-CoA oxygenase subunit PaaC [Flavobacteriales bacterium]
MNARFEYLLRLGDDALLLGQQLGLWTGHGPVLEEDIALTNIGLDQIGQARAWLSFAGKAENKGRDEDRLAFHRSQDGFRNALLCERPNGHFGDTLVRQFLFDAYAVPLHAALAQSKDAEIAAVARKSAKESAYHLRHSSAWLIRLGDGTEESHDKVQASLDLMLPFAGDLFYSDEITATAEEEGWGVDPSHLRSSWETTLTDTLAEAQLRRPDPVPEQIGGRQGRHTEQLSFLLAEMQVLPRTYPDAKW